MEARTSLTQKNISNSYCKNQLPNASNASGIHDAFSAHNAHLVKTAKRANPQEDSAMKDTPHAKVKIVSIHNTKLGTT